eukprot:15456287-Alexandrium_andersonii.AAC.1
MGPVLCAAAAAVTSVSCCQGSEASAGSVVVLPNSLVAQQHPFECAGDWRCWLRFTLMASLCFSIVCFFGCLAGAGGFFAARRAFRE